MFLNIYPSSTYFPSFLIDNIVISPSPIESNLGVLFDSTLSLIPHIFRIRKIRKSITVSLTKTLVNSLSRNARALSYIGPNYGIHSHPILDP